MSTLRLLTRLGHRCLFHTENVFSGEILLPLFTSSSARNFFFSLLWQSKRGILIDRGSRIHTLIHPIIIRKKPNEIKTISKRFSCVCLSNFCVCVCVWQLKLADWTLLYFDAAVTKDNNPRHWSSISVKVVISVAPNWTLNGSYHFRRSFKIVTEEKIKCIIKLRLVKVLSTKYI